MQRDRFLRTTGRDADSIRVMGGFETAPLAVIQGSAFVGYQRYEPAVGEIPGFEGVVASADLTYVARGTTRLSARVDRSLAYSYDVAEPYYVVTSVSATVGRHIVRRLEAFAMGGRQRLPYRRLVPTSAGATSRETLPQLTAAVSRMASPDQVVCASVWTGPAAVRRLRRRTTKAA